MNNNDFLLWEQTSRDTIDVKRIYVDIAEDLISGILLSQIIFWNLPNQEGKTKLRVVRDNKLWLAKGREDWWEECRITSKQFDRAIKILEEKKLVDKRVFKFDGSPKVHLNLNIEVLQASIHRIFTFGENGNYPKGKMEIDERVISTITEITTENTTENIYNQSIYHTDTILGEGDFETIKQYFRDKLNIESLNITYWRRKNLIQEIELNIIEMYFKDSMVINNKQIPQKLIRAALMKLTYFHIEELIHKFVELSITTKINYPKAYMQSMIYNIAFQCDIAITNVVNFNTHNEGR